MYIIIFIIARPVLWDITSMYKNRNELDTSIKVPYFLSFTNIWMNPLTQYILLLF